MLLSNGAARADALTEAETQIVTGDLNSHLKVLASDTFEGRGAGDPGGKAAGVYIAEQLKKLDAIPAGDDGSYFQEFGKGYRNLLAVLPGSDERLKQEYILVCGHYDHVGFGRNKNSLGTVGEIHNGADDNASGVSGILEIIQSAALTRSEFKRSLLFAFWDAEELGLLGSEHWVAQPTVPLDSIRIVVNIDMIGRMREQSLELYGTRTAAGLRQLVCQQNKQNSLLIDENWDLIRNSDHYPFVKKNIPFLLFHTRKHDDYHRPSDDIDKINLDGMQTISRLIFQLVHELASLPELAPIREAAFKETEKNRTDRLKPDLPTPQRLGLSWDSQLAEQGTIQAVKIRAGSPADKSGLLVGDQILQLGSQPIQAGQSFNSVVLAAPQQTEIKISRKGNQRTIPIQLEGQPQRLGVTWNVDDAEPGIILITGVVAGLPAAEAGLLAGDRIVQIKGQPVGSGDQFIEFVAKATDQLELAIERRGQMHVKTVQLLSQP